MKSYGSWCIAGCAPCSKTRTPAPSRLTGRSQEQPPQNQPAVKYCGCCWGRLPLYQAFNADNEQATSWTIYVCMQGSTLKPHWVSRTAPPDTTSTRMWKPRMRKLRAQLRLARASFSRCARLPTARPYSPSPRPADWTTVNPALPEKPAPASRHASSWYGAACAPRMDIISN